MRVCYDEEAAARGDGRGLRARCSLDRFVENAVEIDVDALCDGEDVYIAAVMQHVEEAGVHSGDSACVLPAQSLTLANALEVEHVVKRLGPALGVVGLLNVQLAVADSHGLRARGEPARVAHGAVRQRRRSGSTSSRPRASLAAGEKLRDLELPTPRPTEVSVKAAVLPFARFPGSDPVLGPEMRSTGEVMASAADLPTAFAKAERAAGRPLPTLGHGVPLGPRRRQAGGRRRSRPRSPGSASSSWRRSAPRASLRAAGLEVEEVAKVADADDDEQTVVDLDPRRPLRPDRQHAAGLGRARGRLPHPRGRARRPRALHHDDLGRRRRRARDRERARRDRALAPGANRRPAREPEQDASRAVRVGRRRDGRARTRSCASSAVALDPGVPGPVLHAQPPGARPAAADVALPRAARASSAFLIDPIGPGTRALCALGPGIDSTSSARSGTASTSTVRGRCSSAAASAWRRCRTVAQALGGAAARCSASAPRTTPRRPRSCRAPRSCVEPTLRDRAPARRPGSTCSRAGPSRCSRPCARSRRRRSSPGRRRWPAATAPATAASSRSRAACSGSASRARSCAAA